MHTQSAHTPAHTLQQTYPTPGHFYPHAVIPSILSFLHARLRTATLRHDEEGQVNVVLNPLSTLA